ncbi:tetratricopeptide repeat protein [Dokdonella fugitiva]|uniref:Uncharacterized protein n=1 Tax=Dokdonella fugitiva TaxID=328517 RepID=A0A4R2IDE9_9GAMM|nr:hypothetical protein [Dokdonella fugitiva]TCO42633.1 hypothetical protein EV148_10138 [Dokdonella fugitiva]
MPRIFRIPRRDALVSLAAAVLAIAVYWPVRRAGFAWDDFKFLLESGWMTDRSQWPALLAHGFPEWAGYYRPLGVALYIVETNLSQFLPGPMHLLSLGIHVANIILVGALARILLRQCSAHPAYAPLETTGWPLLAMLVYAVHPALVEPVVWISAQYDMLTTGFTLLGLLVNLRARHAATRAVGVALCFLLAAASKEAALSFPFLLVVFDWFRTRAMPDGAPGLPASWVLRTVARRQWPVYATTLAAGIVYLGLRAWGLGFLVNPATKATWAFWPQLQETCYTYLAYWKLIAWPMNGLAPMYDVDAAPFAGVSMRLIAVDAAAVALALLGLWQWWRRTSIGALVAGVSAALLPVLHLVPQQFAGSLYHCRYAMTAIAVACALLPLLLHDGRVRERSRRLVRSLALVACIWLAFALANTRACIPLWSDDVKLWQWALFENPGSAKAQESLLGAYIRTNDYGRAKELADLMMRGEARASFGSMLNIAALRIALRDVDGASLALAEAKKDMNPSQIRYSYLRSYMLLSGQLGELKDDLGEAEEAYRAAIAFEPQLPEGYMRLALLALRRGDHADARRLYDQALQRYEPAERARIRQQFDAAFTGSDARRADESLADPAR